MKRVTPKVTPRGRETLLERIGRPWTSEPEPDGSRCLDYKPSNPDTSGFKNSKSAIKALTAVGEEFEHCGRQRGSSRCGIANQYDPRVLRGGSENELPEILIFRD